MTPLLSTIVIFFCGIPVFLNKFAQAIADAPAPFTTTLIFLIDFLDVEPQVDVDPTVRTDV